MCALFRKEITILVRSKHKAMNLVTAITSMSCGRLKNDARVIVLLSRAILSRCKPLILLGLQAGTHDMLARKKSRKPSRHSLDQTVSMRFAHPSEGTFPCILRHQVATGDTPLVNTITRIFEKLTKCLLSEPAQMSRIHDTRRLVVEPTAEKVKPDHPVGNIRDRDHHGATRSEVSLRIAKD